MEKEGQFGEGKMGVKRGRGRVVSGSGVGRDGEGLGGGGSISIVVGGEEVEVIGSGGVLNRLQILQQSEKRLHFLAVPNPQQQERSRLSSRIVGWGFRRGNSFWRFWEKEAITRDVLQLLAVKTDRRDPRVLNLQFNKGSIRSSHFHYLRQWQGGIDFHFNMSDADASETKGPFICFLRFANLARYVAQTFRMDEVKGNII
ncbi:Uncharacterized protein Rs2_21787 [Raphanus sativus]|nr:Uncharacterized protein Rs2_21787 [Raphanus sativus]